jgi:hypothetical protein
VRVLAGALLLERAIGVIYLPQSERMSHYLHAILPAQFDAVIHFDETRAVEPLDRGGAGASARPWLLIAHKHMSEWNLR